MNQTPIIICTRQASRRLPKKVFQKLAGPTTLKHILTRLKKTGLPIVLAIPPDELSAYLPFADLYTPFSGPDGVKIFSGDARSPLHRTAEALHNLFPDAKYFVRVTHDDPLIDAQTVGELLAEVQKQGAGYGHSPGIIEGAGVEVISTSNLRYAAKKHGWTEFLSYFVKGEGLPDPGIVALPPRSSIRRPYRLCLDYPEDALVLNIVLRDVGPNASLDAVAQYLDRNGHILNFNRLPSVSVYTCVFNAEKYIEQAMRSVLSNGLDLEYIVVDDGSTDGTLREVAKFAHDKRLRVILNPANLGLASSSNKALAEARGRWVLRLDADDVLLQNAIQSLIKLAEDGSQIVYPSFHEIGESGQYMRTDVDPKERHHAGGALMSRAFVNELRFRDELRLGDSAELYNRAVARGGKIGYLPEATFLYRKHSESLTAEKA